MSSQVPEYGESIAVRLPKIHVCQERSTCAGDGMMPSVTQRSSTAKCHSASSSNAGSTSSQGAAQPRSATYCFSPSCSGDLPVALARKS